MSVPGRLPRATYPFPGAFYRRLSASRASFELVASHLVAPNTGFGFRVEAGQAFRFVQHDGAQIVDVCLVNADDPDEFYSTGPQLAIEGGRITEGTRLWGSPPLSRPLATCIGDTLNERGRSGEPGRDAAPPDHICHSDCCSTHLWLLAGAPHQRACYDNLRDGLAMVGLGQEAFRCNVNLFMGAAIDPGSGNLVVRASKARPGDFLELYAEVSLRVAVSICPAGAGGATSVSAPGEAKASPHPVGIEIYDPAVAPLGWPLPAPAA